MSAEHFAARQEEMERSPRDEASARGPLRDGAMQPKAAGKNKSKAAPVDNHILLYEALPLFLKSECAVMLI